MCDRVANDIAVDYILVPFRLESYAAVVAVGVDGIVVGGEVDCKLWHGRCINKKIQASRTGLGLESSLTWIRTKTDSTKNCSATITP